MRIVNVKKFIRSILFVLVIIFIISILLSKGSLSYKTLEYKTICIERGDTLWSIAYFESKINPYYENMDIRDIISDIKNVNNLSCNDIIENQQLIVPVEEL